MRSRHSSPTPAVGDAITADIVPHLYERSLMLKDLESDGFVAGPFAFVLLPGLVEGAFSHALADPVDEPSRVGGYSRARIGVINPSKACEEKRRILSKEVREGRGYDDGWE